MTIVTTPAADPGEPATTLEADLQEPCRLLPPEGTEELAQPGEELVFAPPAIRR